MLIQIIRGTSVLILHLPATGWHSPPIDDNRIRLATVCRRLFCPRVLTENAARNDGSVSGRALEH